MKIQFTLPSRLTFWRLVLAITLPLAWFSGSDVFKITEKLGVAPLSSKTWLGLLGVLVLIGALCLLSIVLSFTPQRNRLLGALQVVEHTPAAFHRAGLPILLAALAAYPLIVFHPYYGDLLSGQGWLRLFLFWLIGLTAMQALKLAFPKMEWGAAFLTAMLLLGVIYRITLYLPDITPYPFTTGWSETSRFYGPALFVSQKVFGERLPWPILNPTLHLLLVPPFLLEAPLWFHRFWQVALRFGLVGLIAPALLYRLKIESRPLRWLTGIWIFLYLFTLPLYLHLAVPVFMMLWGFSAKDERRTWTWLVLASIWAGLSRVNWYPVPGVLAAVLYFLEVPLEKKGWRYLLIPALWFLAGTAIAFVSLQVYILVSGISSAGDFYTTLGSTKLWYRMWPNASYSLGVLPATLIFSAPLWLALFLGWRHNRSKAGVARILLIIAALLVLFVGGLLVSMKIGGGADIHNMDAYAVLLLIILAYLFFGRYAQENEQSEPAPAPQWHWSIVALLVLIPVWFAARGTAGFLQYDAAKSQATLEALQQRVDAVNAQGGEILFISQRHLVSMHMLRNVKLVPQYELEELMEMAISQNDAYLQDFRADIEKHRFAAIVVVPLRINMVGEQDAMGAENNAWTRSVAKKILCNYKEAAIYPADRIAIYVPQQGSQQCP